MNYMFNEMVKLIQYDYIMRSEVFSTNAFIQICNFSMNAALFRRFACRPAAFLVVWGGQTEREPPLADFKLHAARVRVCVSLAALVGVLSGVGGTGRGAVRRRRQAASLSRCCGCGYRSAGLSRQTIYRWSFPAS